VKLPAVLIFLGVLGGVATFGIIGVLLGPVLLAVARTMFLDWGRAEESGPDRPGVIDQPQ
jgi:predicted PurR-regulated permease PerM